MSAVPANQVDAAIAEPELIEPNQYHLSGGGISIAYYPDGFGPILPGGPICLFYQDGRTAERFTREQLRVVESPDLGTIVSATLLLTPDVGSTTFSIVLPTVRLPAGLGSSVPIKTFAVTTIHRTFLLPPGFGQQEVYQVVELTGDARNGILPL